MAQQKSRNSLSLSNCLRGGRKFDKSCTQLPYICLIKRLQHPAPYKRSLDDSSLS